MYRRPNEDGKKMTAAAGEKNGGLWGHLESRVEPQNGKKPFAATG